MRKLSEPDVNPNTLLNRQLLPELTIVCSIPTWPPTKNNTGGNTHMLTYTGLSRAAIYCSTNAVFPDYYPRKLRLQRLLQGYNCRALDSVLYAIFLPPTGDIA